MVKRELLEKKSNEELLKYIRPDSRFVYDAIKIAFSILKERGYPFSNIEEERITHLINSKKEEITKITDINKWDINANDESSSVAFFSQKAVWFFSVFLGVHVGSVLLAINLFNISKRCKAWLVILFGFVYSIILYYIYNFARIYLVDYSILVFIFITGIGASILQFYFWDKYLANIKYRKKNPIKAFFICVILYSLVFLTRSILLI